jgi:hypothetical protein
LQVMLELDFKQLLIATIIVLGKSATGD